MSFSSSIPKSQYTSAVFFIAEMRAAGFFLTARGLNALCRQHEDSSVEAPTILNQAIIATIPEGPAGYYREEQSVVPACRSFLVPSGSSL
jgi:hypothetical protein